MIALSYPLPFRTTLHKIER
ncbi:hypothetical protein [Hirschia litorea]|uniref:Uncharacterized protein n=1 Tax=Hirschia litorea TaxID=1199156 RepID=A0ABW2IPC4_9PROT